MENISQRGVEVVDAIGQAAPRNSCIYNDWIGYVGPPVLRESRVKEDLRCVRVLLPHESHVYRFSTLHGNERRYLAAVRGRAGVRIGKCGLRSEGRPWAQSDGNCE